MTFPFLGSRTITRFRYGATVWAANGVGALPAPVSAQVQASVDVAPMGSWEQDESGNRTLRVVEIISPADFRGASPSHNADRVDIGDGRIYQVHDVTKLERFEGSASPHWEVRAVQVRGGDIGTP